MTMIDDSSYVSGMNTSDYSGAQPSDPINNPKDPNEEIVQEQMLENEALRISSGALVKILEKEVSDVEKISDLDAVKDMTPEAMQARGIETVIRSRYIGLVTNLINRIKSSEENDA